LSRLAALRWLPPWRALTLAAMPPVQAT